MYFFCLKIQLQNRYNFLFVPKWCGKLAQTQTSSKNFFQQISAIIV
jgi:hypothetical protein